jgi:hypothetical protein
MNFLWLNLDVLLKKKKEGVVLASHGRVVTNFPPSFVSRGWPWLWVAGNPHYQLYCLQGKPSCWSKHDLWTEIAVVSGHQVNKFKEILDTNNHFIIVRTLLLSNHVLFEARLHSAPTLIFNIDRTKRGLGIWD